MPGQLKGPYTKESSCRWDSNAAVGNVGVEYEFDIKMPKIRANITENEFEDEAEKALDILADDLRARYTWIGQICRAGRSGGWLSVEDKKGLATREKLRNMIEMVTKAKRAFIAHIEKEYPAR